MKLVKFSVALFACVLLAACTSGTKSVSSATPTVYNSDPAVLKIVAGSEQRSVVDTIVTPWCKNVRHITCDVTYLGSVDQARLLQGGNAPYDAFWFASTVFEQLGDQAHALQDVRSMSITPIVYAGWKSEMDKLGFVGKSVTIADVLNAVESKKTSVWVTNPTQSNSGASVYLGFLNYFANNPTGKPLTSAQLTSAPVQQGITRFVRAFNRTPPSTGTLMDDCVAQPSKCRTVFTYEDLVMEYNKKLVDAGHEPLYVVYPQGSLAIADAPLGFLAHGDSAKKKENFDALQTYLADDPTAKQKLLELGRRPADITGLALAGAPSAVFNPAWGIQTTIKNQQLTYPAGAVIDQALNAYQTSFRSPADVVYCLDGSGSMSTNGGWTGVSQAANLLFDPVASKKYFLQVSPQDRTTVMIFNDTIKGGPWTVSGNSPKSLLDLKTKILNQGPDGGTGIYDCLQAAADFYKTHSSLGLKRLVILMTDGQNTSGGTEGINAIAREKVPVIAVAFGSDADTAALQDIANVSSGALIKSDNLVTALRNATSYK